MTRFKVKVTSSSKSELRPFSKAISAICNGSWQLTIDSLTRTQYPSLALPNFYIYPSLCVTWLWTWEKHHLWRDDCQSCTGLIYYYYLLWQTNVVDLLCSVETLSYHHCQHQQLMYFIVWMLWVNYQPGLTQRPVSLVALSLLCQGLVR